MKKKLLAFVFSVLMLLALTACGDDSGSVKTEIIPIVTEKSTTVISVADDSNAPVTEATEAKTTQVSTELPTNAPTQVPTNALTQAPTQPPTQTPTNAPTTNVPTTNAPTTNAPTTNAPTTNAPTSTAPATPTTTAHKHSYTAQVTVAAGCTSNGVKTFTCSCGDSYTESISALGHSWRAATCTQAKKCSRCSVTEGSPVAHSWVSATCSEPKHCSACGATEGSALEHTWKAATCTTPKRCSVCGTTSGSTISHNYSSGKCTMCGKSDPNAPTFKLVNSLPYTPALTGYRITSYSTRVSGSTLYLTLSGVRVEDSIYSTVMVTMYGANLGSVTHQKSHKFPSVSVGSSFTMTIAISNGIVPEYSKYEIWLT